MFIKILFNYRGERTHFQGERTQGECVVRANRPDTIYMNNLGINLIEIRPLNKFSVYISSSLRDYLGIRSVRPNYTFTLRLKKINNVCINLFPMNQITGNKIYIVKKTLKILDNFLSILFIKQTLFVLNVDAIIDSVDWY